MSAGDIDDVVGDEEYLEQLRKDNIPFHLYLLKAFFFKPIRTFFIPFGAGISEDGQRVYISRDLQTNIQGVECESALVRHETTEWGLRFFCQIGEDYLTDPTGHRLANRAEHDRIVQLLDTPDAWFTYTTIIDNQIIREERTDLKDKPLPRDLARYPYEDAEWDKIEEAMYNEYSIEEWDRLGVSNAQENPI
jgi:hypothetical protein